MAEPLEMRKGTARQRHIPDEYKQAGHGQFAGEGDPGQDFPESLRSRLARSIENAYPAGKIGRPGSGLHQKAMRFYSALVGTHSMLYDLRLHLGFPEDGAEDKAMIQQVRDFAMVVQDIQVLYRWIVG